MRTIVFDCSKSSAVISTFYFISLPPSSFSFSLFLSLLPISFFKIVFFVSWILCRSFSSLFFAHSCYPEYCGISSLNVVRFPHLFSLSNQNHQLSFLLHLTPLRDRWLREHHQSTHTSVSNPNQYLLSLMVLHLLRLAKASSFHQAWNHTHIVKKNFWKAKYFSEQRWVTSEWYL